MEGGGENNALEFKSSFLLNPSTSGRQAEKNQPGGATDSSSGGMIKISKPQTATEWLRFSTLVHARCHSGADPPRANAWQSAERLGR
jgi:hypothetical protein